MRAGAVAAALGMLALVTIAAGCTTGSGDSAPPPPSIDPATTTAGDVGGTFGPDAPTGPGSTAASPVIDDDLGPWSQFCADIRAGVYGDGGSGWASVLFASTHLVETRTVPDPDDVIVDDALPEWLARIRVDGVDIETGHTVELDDVIVDRPLLAELAHRPTPTSILLSLFALDGTEPRINGVVLLTDDDYEILASCSTTEDTILHDLIGPLDGRSFAAAFRSAEQHQRLLDETVD